MNFCEVRDKSLRLWIPFEKSRIQHSWKCALIAIADTPCLIRKLPDQAGAGENIASMIHHASAGAAHSRGKLTNEHSICSTTAQRKQCLLP